MSTIFGLVFCFVLFSVTMASSKIDAPLLEILNEGQAAKISVSMAEGTDEIQKSLENREYADRADRLNTVNRELTAHAERSQASVIQLLEKTKERIPVTWETLWISNQIVVNGADLKLVNDIAAIENVSKIEGEKFVQLL